MKKFLIAAGVLIFSNSLGDAFLFDPLEEELEGNNWKEAEQRAQGEPFTQALAAMFRGEYFKARSLMPPPLTEGQERFQAYVNFMAKAAGKFDQEVSTQGVALRFTGRDRVLEEGALEALSACREKVKEWIGFEPDAPVIVEFYRSKKDFALASTLGDELLKKSGVIGIAKFRRLMLITPEALPFGYAWRDSVCHEYLHHALKSKAGLKLPLWFHEGFARFSEAFWRGADFKPLPGDKEELLRAAQDKKLVPFERMEPSMVYLDNEAQISLAFTQVALSMERLAPKMKQLLWYLSDRISFRRAFEKVYSKTLKEFEDEIWEAWGREAEMQGKLKKSGALRTVLSMEEPLDEEKLFLGPKVSHLLRLGDRMKQRGSPEAALRLYRQASDQEPSNPFVLSRMSRAYLALKQGKEALEAADKLTRDNPHWAPGYEVLGDALRQMGRMEEAVGAYSRYFDFNPYHQALYKKIAFLCLDLGDKTRAKVFFKKALILDPSDQEASEAAASLQ